MEKGLDKKHTDVSRYLPNNAGFIFDVRQVF